jgi:hypothetical protein
LSVLPASSWFRSSVIDSESRLVTFANMPVFSWTWVGGPRRAAGMRARAIVVCAWGGFGLGWVGMGGGVS